MKRLTNLNFPVKYYIYKKASFSFARILAQDFKKIGTDFSKAWINRFLICLVQALCVCVCDTYRYPRRWRLIQIFPASPKLRTHPAPHLQECWMLFILEGHSTDCSCAWKVTNTSTRKPRRISQGYRNVLLLSISSDRARHLIWTSDWFPTQWSADSSLCMKESACRQWVRVIKTFLSCARISLNLLIL